MPWSATAATLIAAACCPRQPEPILNVSTIIIVLDKKKGPIYDIRTYILSYRHNAAGFRAVLYDIHSAVKEVVFRSLPDIDYVERDRQLARMHTSTAISVCVGVCDQACPDIKSQQTTAVVYF